MAPVTEEQVKQALAGVMDPELKRNLVDLGMVWDVKVKDTQVRFTLALTVPECPLKDQIVAEARAAVLALSNVVMVSSPQDLAEMVVRKAARMGQTMQVPLLGLVGNIEAYPTEAFVPIARRLEETASEPRRSPVQPR